MTAADYCRPCFEEYGDEACTPADPCCVAGGCPCEPDCFTEESGAYDLEGMTAMWCRDHEEEYVR